MKVYGIKNCDTVKKAMRALESVGAAPELIDVRVNPLSEGDLSRFYDTFGDTLVNKRSTTWRGLDEAERAEPAVKLLSAHPTLMKRPVIEKEAQITLGWDATAQAVWL